MASKDVATSFINSLRRGSKFPCTVCGQELVPNDERIRTHLLENHADYLRGKDLGEVIGQIKKKDGGVQSHKPPDVSDSTTNDPILVKSDNPFAPQSGLKQDAEPPPKRVKSPIALPQSRPRSSSPPRRSRARASSGDVDPAFNRRGQVTGKLWTPEDASQVTPSKPKASNKPRRGDGQGRHRQLSVDNEHPPEDETATLIKQPETRPISQEQLVAEVKGIYAGLVMVESKCIEVDNAQSSQNDAKLNNEQWQALIALHRTLLHEHHDFFLASQHPSASPALRRLASKYAMPARMWRHGIHSFLELLRHRLPASLEHMLAFIYLAYSMMALLYETVPAFEDTWIECLGDLGRYRMAIEDDDIRDREVWTSVSRHWYSRASDKAPTTGRLYHHLAILARPNALQQLFYYTKSLCVPIPFSSARESIMTLFDPILSPNSAQHSRLMQIDVAYVKAHGILFSDKSAEQFKSTTKEFLDSLDNHIGRTTRRWMESGYYIGISNCCSLLSYGKEDNVIFKAIRPQRSDEPAEVNMDTGDSSDQITARSFEQALELAEGTYEVVFRRFADPNILPYFHVVLVFVHHLTFFPGAMAYIERTFPWKLVSLLLNSILLSYRDYPRIHSEQFPRPDKELPRPLPEDFAMKGLLWVDQYFPIDWFSNDKIDDDEKYFEVASMTDERKERILWLGCRIAQHGHWLVYDEALHQFGVVPQYEKELESVSKDPEMMNMSETLSRASSTVGSATGLHKLEEQDDQEMLDVDEIDEDISSKPIIRQ